MTRSHSAPALLLFQSAPRVVRLVAVSVALATGGCAVTAPVKGAWAVGSFAGDALWETGEAAYGAGRLTVRVADGVLDGGERALRVTILSADAAGAVARTTRDVQAAALETELAALRRADGVIDVFVEPAPRL